MEQEVCYRCFLNTQGKETPSPEGPLLPDAAPAPSPPGGTPCPVWAAPSRRIPCSPSPRSCRHNGFGGKGTVLTRRERSGSQSKILLGPHSLGGNQSTAVPAGRRQLVPSAAAFPYGSAPPARACSEKGLAPCRALVPPPQGGLPPAGLLGAPLCAALALRAAQPKTTPHFYPGPVGVLKPHVPSWEHSAALNYSCPFPLPPSRDAFWAEHIYTAASNELKRAQRRGQELPPAAGCCYRASVSKPCSCPRWPPPAPAGLCAGSPHRAAGWHGQPGRLPARGGESAKR